jgi:serine phosphatase RsbU (regulator of sigma subunit)
MVLEPGSDEVRIVNAGHMAPLMFHAADQSTSEPGEEASGLPIGIDEGMSYESFSFPMKRGDVAVMYTDGINEAMNAEDELYSIDRIRACVAKGGGAEAIMNRIKEDVHKFIAGSGQDDDMCMVVIERV